jgi:hypothetical protein
MTAPLVAYIPSWMIFLFLEFETIDFQTMGVSYLKWTKNVHVMVVKIDVMHSFCVRCHVDICCICEDGRRKILVHIWATSLVTKNFGQFFGHHMFGNQKFLVAIFSMCGLVIYIKQYLTSKEELWKFKYFMMQKYNLQKNFFKQTPSQYHNSITNPKF